MTRLSLQWKIQLVTTTVLTALFLLTGIVLQRRVVRSTTQSLEAEAKSSLHAYESLWKARADLLAAVSLALSGMSDVRAAFGTGDAETIRDTAGERWAKLASENAVFLVADPQGRVIASFGEQPLASTADRIPVIQTAMPRFPQQVSGLVQQQGRLYQVVITPVYVEAGQGPALLNVLVAGFQVDARVAQRLKDATGGSEFVFRAGSSIVASTLSTVETSALLPMLIGTAQSRVGGQEAEYTLLRRPLLDVEGHPIAELCILRSFAGARESLLILERDLVWVWVPALIAALLLIAFLARRILRPIAQLDAAAAEVSQANYASRVPVQSGDELGRLAQTFNDMCASIQRGREELIRQERLSTVGRLSSSLVHDLRNPLAAIYAGSEMLVDSDLAPALRKRLAVNIYRASQQIQSMLDELVEASRQRGGTVECGALRPLIEAAWYSLAAAAEAQHVRLQLTVPDELELPLQSGRMQRVFLNLLANAVEAMPEGGCIAITARAEEAAVLVEVADTGPGVAAELRDQLFQPFASRGKKNGMGLGLALSRQTLLDHGGDLWFDQSADLGAHFWLRLPRPVVSRQQNEGVLLT